MNEREFYDELGRIPGPPPDMYSAIRRRIRRKTAIARAVFAIAAIFILTVGTSGAFFLRQGAGQTLSPEVSEEVQTIHGYLAGEDIEQASLSYAVVEGEGD
jgi:hypothetical protein